VEAAERFADGHATRDEMRRAAEAAYLLGEGMETDGTGVDSAGALIAAAAAAGEAPHASWPEEPQLGTARTAEWASEWAARCPLLRDVFGNPFRRPPLIDPCWRTPTVLALAESIYEERRFTDLPVLADALEEAGCSDAELLRHLRSPGPHVRGCFALDVILGKS
jgi:hypothetical protein